MTDTEQTESDVKVQTVEFLGEQFALKDGGPSGYKLARFAVAVRRSEEGDLLTNVAAPLEFVEACLAESERGRFAAHADANEATLEDIQHVVSQLFGLETERPTVRPSDSSDGPSTIEPSSPSNVDVNVSGRFDGRPDLRKHLRMAKEAQAS